MLMQFASYIYDGHPFLQNVEDGSATKEEELEEAVHSFLGLDMEKLKRERERMEGMLRNPNKKVV